MNNYLRHLIGYFEYVFHPAGSRSSGNSAEKRKSKPQKNKSLYLSPESFNIRGGVIKKQEKLRRNPAP